MNGLRDISEVLFKGAKQLYPMKDSSGTPVPDEFFYYGVPGTIVFVRMESKNDVEKDETISGKAHHN